MHRRRELRIGGARPGRQGPTAALTSARRRGRLAGRSEEGVEYHGTCGALDLSEQRLDRRRRASARAPAGSRRRASESTGRRARRTDGARDRSPASGACSRSRRSRPIRTGASLYSLISETSSRAYRRAPCASSCSGSRPGSAAGTSAAVISRIACAVRTAVRYATQRGCVAAENLDQLLPRRRGLPVCSLVRVEHGNRLTAEHERHRERDTPGRQRGKGRRGRRRRCRRVVTGSCGGGHRRASPLPVRPTLHRPACTVGTPGHGPLLELRAVDDEQRGARGLERRAADGGGEHIRQRRRTVYRANRVEQARRVRSAGTAVDRRGGSLEARDLRRGRARRRTRRGPASARSPRADAPIASCASRASLALRLDSASISSRRRVSASTSACAPLALRLELRLRALRAPPRNRPGRARAPAASACSTSRRAWAADSAAACSASTRTRIVSATMVRSTSERVIAISD